MKRNAPGQKLIVFAFDSSTGAPKTALGASDIVMYVDKDHTGLNPIADTIAVQISATNASGYYRFDLTAGETDAECLLFTGKSGVSNVVIVAQPPVIYTNFPQTGDAFGNTTFLKNVSEGDRYIDESGTPFEQVIKLKGTATELVRKRLLDVDGNDISDETTFVARAVE